MQVTGSRVVALPEFRVFSFTNTLEGVPERRFGLLPAVVLEVLEGLRDRRFGLSRERTVEEVLE